MKFRYRIAFGDRGRKILRKLKSLLEKEGVDYEVRKGTFYNKTYGGKELLETLNGWIVTSKGRSR